MRGRAAGLLAIAILALAVLAGCGLAGPTVAPAPLGPQLPDAATASAVLPTWAPGDSWTFDGRGDRGPYTYRLTVLGEETFEGEPAYKAQTPTYTYWYAKNTLGFLARAKAGTVVRRVKPSTGFEWPLAIGKSWIRDADFTDTESGNQRYTYTDDWKVEGYGEIKVPAGTFKAFKVARRVRNSDAYDEYWYSPEAKSWVKAKGASAAGEYDEELVSYKVQ